MTHSDRYLTLDALRGIAAVAVLWVHVPEMLGVRLLGSGGIAVDLFFGISGFVLAKAYEGRLRAGMSLTDLLLVRLVRLFPVYLVGIGTYVAFIIASGKYEVSTLLTSVLFTVLFLPVPEPVSVEPHFLFAIGWARWSLFCELVANVVYAAVAKRLCWARLAGWVALSGLLLAATFIMEVGDEQTGILVTGVPRALFSFFVGVALSRMRIPRRRGLAAPILAVLSFAMIAIPSSGLGLSPAAYNLFAIVVCLPLTVGIASIYEPPDGLRSSFRALGDLSYPFYLLHMPIVLWTAAIFPRLVGLELRSFAPWSGIGLVLIIATVSFWLDRVYDQPLRARLKRWVGLPGTAAPTATVLLKTRAQAGP